MLRAALVPIDAVKTFCLAAAASVASLALAPALAATCPATLDKSRQILLVDDKGNRMLLEAMPGQMVRRTEDATTADGPWRQSVDGYQGFAAEAITSTNGDKTVVQYIKFANADYARLKQFLPLKVGAELSLDNEAIEIPPAGARPVPSGAANILHTTLKVLREEQLALGPCAYRTLVVERLQVNGDRSLAVRSLINFAPDLGGWLKISNTYRASGKPETTVTRSIETVSAPQ